jgi:hypothetical protein
MRELLSEEIAEIDELMKGILLLILPPGKN